MKYFFLKIINIDIEIYNGNAESLFLRGYDGDLIILYNHCPLLTTIKPGKIKIIYNKIEKNFFISGGLLEVYSNNVSLLSTSKYIR